MWAVACSAAGEVDRHTLTFGRTGPRHGLVICDARGVDVNRDGRVDLVCRVDAPLKGFKPGDAAGVLQDEVVGGPRIRSTDEVSVLKSRRA